MDSFALTLFLGVTLGHFALCPYWLRRWWGQRLTSPEALLFHSVVCGFGSLQAVLHLLACTIGISLPAGVIALSLLHALLYAAQWRRGRGSPVQPAPRSGATLADVPVLSLIGVTAVATGVLSWFVRAPQSFQTLGIDAEHYHVPYAVNYAQGENIFSFAVTPHLYPMGTSILAAWFFQPFADPLLLDLTNLLPFLLLFVACVYLFTLLTDEPGLEWTPAVFLLLFTGRLFRVSVFISADLFYAAAFAAVFTQLCAVWVRGRIATHDWLALALCTGMLVGSKIQGLMSAVLLFGFFTAAVVIRYAVRRQNPGVQLSPGTAAAAGALFVAAGGIWLVRNWVLFGSPMAPAGLQLFGITIFPGASGRGQDEPLSILKDMHTIPGYDLWSRFVFYTKDWVGTWPAIFVLGLVVVLLDALYQLSTRRRLAARTEHLLFALLAFAVLCLIHCYVLVGVSFSSLEWLHGQPLRYILPFYALYAVLGYAGLFSKSVPWIATLRLKWLVLLPALAYLLFNYDTLSQMPVQWNRLYGREDLLDFRFAPLALVMVAPWLVHIPPLWSRYARYAVAGLLVIAVMVLVFGAAAEHDRLARNNVGQYERELARFTKDGTARTKYRGVYYRVVAYERQHSVVCRQRRFFMVSRFDFPLELQDPSFHNFVFDVQEQLTQVAGLLRSDGPGQRECDYIVAVYRDASENGTEYGAISEAAIPRLLLMRDAIEAIGDFDRYRVYRVRRG